MAVIEVDRLTKHFGPVTAVDDLSFGVAEGSVTGFLGPNGAGKTTTLRMLLGLVTPTSGQAWVNGRRYADLAQPAREVGAVLEASSFHPGRTARAHLRALAAAADLPPRRADEVLSQVGLDAAAGRRVGGFSLGMRQRLGLAAALLGDPQVLILDEPANGLDPEGIHWLRGFLRHLATSGRTVLVSSHVLAEVAQTVDDVIIISRGRLVTQAPLASLTERVSAGVKVRSPQVDRLRDLLSERSLLVEPAGPDALVVHDTSTETVGELAAAAGLVLHELTGRRSNLEKVFLDLTGQPAEEASA